MQGLPTAVSVALGGRPCPLTISIIQLPYGTASTGYTPMHPITLLYPMGSATFSTKNDH